MKVAVCISGQLRSFRRTYKSLLDNLIHPNSADVFVHAWDKKGFTNKLALLLPDGFSIRLPSVYHHDLSDSDRSLGLDRCKLEKDFPCLYQAVQSAIRPSEMVAKADLQLIYQTHQCEVEEYNPAMFRELEDPVLSKSSDVPSIAKSMFPMYYKIWACDMLRRRSEAEAKSNYDIVVRVRPDFLFPAPLVLGDIHVRPNTFYGLYNQMYIDAGVQGQLLNDQFFIGDSLSMAAICDLWKCLGEVALSTQVSAEHILLHYVGKNLSFDTEEYKPQRLPERCDDKLEFRDMLEVLPNDILRARRLGLDISFLNGCVADACVHEASRVYVYEGYEALQAFSDSVSCEKRIHIEPPYLILAKACLDMGDVLKARFLLVKAIVNCQDYAMPDLFRHLFARFTP